MNADEAAKHIHQWCMRDAKCTSSARALAEVYVSTYMDTARLLRFADLRALNDPQRQWALTLIQGYCEGKFHATYDRAMELADMYGLNPDHDQVED